jgi:hypothetical protein
MATMEAITERDRIKTITTHYIDGAFVESHGREVMDIIKPTNGKVIARVTLGDEEDTRPFSEILFETLLGPHKRPSRKFRDNLAATLELQGAIQSIDQHIRICIGLHSPDRMASSMMSLRTTFS